MSDITLTRMRLTGGVWEGLLASASGVKPKLWLRHREDVVAEPELHAATGATANVAQWFVRFQFPLDRLNDGVQTFIVEDASTGDALAHETVIAGEIADDTLHAEVALLRAELDLLKRSFRRHCAEG